MQNPIRMKHLATGGAGRSICFSANEALLSISVHKGKDATMKHYQKVQFHIQYKCIKDVVILKQ